MAVLTTRQLVSALGGNRAAAVQRGQWQPVVRGACTDGAPDLATRAEAAALVLSPDSVPAGRSALWPAGAKHVDGVDPRLQVVVPRGAAVPKRPGVLAREALLAPTDVAQVAGVRCLRAARARSTSPGVSGSWTASPCPTPRCTRG